MESELYSKAMAFFHDASLTEKWLNHPSAFFGNISPLERYHSEGGRQEVLNYLDVCIKDNSKK